MGVDQKKLKQAKTKYLMALGAHIERLRRAKGYSMDRLSLEAGLSRATMARVESGTVDAQIFTLARIASTIEVPLHKLVNFDGDDKAMETYWHFLSE